VHLETRLIAPRPISHTARSLNDDPKGGAPMSDMKPTDKTAETTIAAALRCGVAGTA
jgi:hypothetical protein